LSLPGASPRRASPGSQDFGTHVDAHARAAHRGGPFLLLIPLLLAIATVWWIRRADDPGMPTRPPARTDPDSTHEVLGGELEIAGAQLAFWLAPWEPDPLRQAFQARALRTRYGLDAGEPWRLRLEWRAAQPAAATAASSIDTSLLAIEDERGRALEPLRLERPMDPLAALLAPPAQSLTPGSALDLCLWGRAPAAQARLVGPASVEGALDVQLAARPLRLGDRVGPMARLDPAAAATLHAPGKIAPPEASATPVRGAGDARY